MKTYNLSAIKFINKTISKNDVVYYWANVAGVSKRIARKYFFQLQNSGIETVSINFKNFQKKKCLGFTKKGFLCSRLASIDNKYCFQHRIQNKKITSIDYATAKKFDQYYTKKITAELCVLWYRKLVKISKDLDLIIEPSAGCGSFCSFLSNLVSNTLFLDLFPKGSDIIQKDFLTLEISAYNYSDIHIIGNPPFKRLTAFIRKASQIGDYIGFILPLSYKKDSLKNRFPLNFHCIFSKELPPNSFVFEGSTKNVPTVFQIWKKESYNRKLPKKLISNFFDFVKKKENPCLSFQRVGSRSGRLTSDTNKTESTHYFLKFKKNISLNSFLAEYKSVKFLHNNTVGQKSISKQELIYETNKMILKNIYER